MGQYQTHQTRCLRGHLFDEKNTYRLPRRERVCRLCIKLRNHRYWARRHDERLIARFVLRIESWDRGCWLFGGAAAKGDYRMFSASGQHNYAHRWAYLYFKGPVSAGLEIDHLCCKPRCVNPDHLEAVTPKENVRRSWATRGVVVKSG